MWYTKNNLRIAQAQPDKLTQFKDWLKGKAPLFSNYIKAVSDDFDINKIDKEFQYTLTDDSTHIQSLEEISKTGIRLTRKNKDNILQKADPGEAPKAGNVSGYVDRDKGYSYTQELNADRTEFVQPASNTNNNNNNNTNSTPTSQAKQEPTLLPDFEKNDLGQIKLKDGSKPTLESNLQKEAQQMGLSTNKFSNRFNNNINEQDYYKQIIMNHINNGQVTNYTPESRRMIADQILS